MYNHEMPNMVKDRCKDWYYAMIHSYMRDKDMVRQLLQSQVAPSRKHHVVFMYL
jgi:hypothetical protein